MLNMDLDMNRRRGGGGGPPPVDYVALMSTLLSGTPGFVTDPSDTTINFTDTAGTIPVATPGVDKVARFNTKFGTTVYNCQQATPASQYLWNGASFQLDGIDDLLQQTNATWPSGMTALTYTTRVFLDDLSTDRALLGLSTTATTTVRLLFRAKTNGSITLSLRRLDGDGQQDFQTAAGILVAGNAYTLQFRVNYLNGAVEIFVNGVSVFTGTYTGTDGLSGVSATNSARWRDALNPTNTLNDWFRAKLGCQVVAVNQYLSGADLANCRGFVERNPL